MFKKIIIIITIIIGVAVLGFNAYKLMFNIEFKNYLSQKHQEKTFNLHWVKYDFIYNKFYATGYCKNDGTDFYIRNDRGTISEEYLETRNRRDFNKIINSYLENEDIYQYIRSLYAGVDKNESVNKDGEINFDEIPKIIYVGFYDDKIQDSQVLAETSYKIISILKRNRVNFNSISFTAEISSGVYELRLEGEETTKEVKEIFSLIKRIK